jgi:hypothetical protein
MSLFGQTLLLYALVGAGVALALYLRTPTAGRWEQAFRVLTAVLFWPLYVPLLLSGTADGRPAPLLSAAPQDEMAALIGQVETELEAALGSLAGWADEVLARDGKRLRQLPAAWRLQAERVRAMDRLLAVPDNGPAHGNDGIVAPELVGEVRAPGVSERLRLSQEARRQNLERLRGLRQRASDDLVGTLAWVRELLSLLHLARFTGAPPARAEELLAQAAAASQGLAEVFRLEPAAGTGMPLEVGRGQRQGGA